MACVPSPSCSACIGSPPCRPGTARVVRAPRAAGTRTARPCGQATPCPGVREEPAGYYLCDEGGRLAVYSCTADGVPRQRLELTDIYINLLPEQDALQFKAGYLVWDRQELETLLEDLGA